MRWLYSNRQIHLFSTGQFEFVLLKYFSTDNVKLAFSLFIKQVDISILPKTARNWGVQRMARTKANIYRILVRTESVDAGFAFSELSIYSLKYTICISI